MSTSMHSCVEAPRVRPHTFRSGNTFLLICMMSFSLGVPILAQSGTNLLTNPGFESGTTNPFTGAQNGAISVESSYRSAFGPLGGQRFLRIRATAMDAYTTPYRLNAGAAVASAAEGESFTFSAFTRSTQSGIPVTIRIFSLDLFLQRLKQFFGSSKCRQFLAKSAGYPYLSR